MSEGSTTADIQFDISWDNSWRYGVFYDAAWVFAKVSVNDGAWIHATISGVTSIGASGTSLTIDVPTDSKGVFLYRSADATGTLSTTAVKLQWFRQGDGVAYNAAKVKIQVFAIEMVHIPQGSFYLGDGTARSGTTNSHFFDAASAAGAAVKITSTQPYISSASDGSGTAGDIAWVNESTYAGALPTSRTQLNSSFPTGYNSFYIMKYGVTQGQYRDFLNTLTRAQQVTRVATTITSGTTAVTNVYVMSNTSTVSYRNGIACATTVPSTTPVTFYCNLNANATANESADGEWIACNYLSWMDLCAYADWAGLRPMTELEFEKACRGSRSVLAGEYAWGSTSITQVTGITNSGQLSETATNSGNCAYGNHASVQGPMRSGFASTATSTTREGAGASYYGIMDLSGNLWERPVTVMGSQSGTTLSIFTGLNGDGSLASNGNANVDYWPGNAGTNGVNGEVTGASGSGFRGGTWNNDASYARVSDRYYAAYTVSNRDYHFGGRFARTSP
ncbi:MAG: SUMF1/EgtB/PvdO family nonheme iron enzyme [Candidatus Omnitrophica bacterium]|nr:SUMF1/EgtB/PvdO family nonheme iron enzyme [Candidatus Omnitrophota bacterium]